MEELFRNLAIHRLDADDLVERVSQVEELAALIEDALERGIQDENLAMVILRWRIVSIEVQRLMIRAEELLEPTALDELRLRINQMDPPALNRWTKYRTTNYEEELENV
jgi:hypothetical protein